MNIVNVAQADITLGNSNISIQRMSVNFPGIRYSVIQVIHVVANVVNDIHKIFRLRFI